tara:strand:+ start:851 stop:4081 length:3231 start_codon:yes stop_codon:yes gene_type:complete
MTEAIIIESNRINATVDDYRSDRNGFTASNSQNSNQYNRWRSNYPSGLEIKTGDELQVEACMLNSIGGGEEVIEFTGANSNDSNSNISKLKDNKFKLNVLYYIQDRKEFNFPLPMAGHKIVKNPRDVSYGGLSTDFYKEQPASGDLENIAYSGGSESQELTNKRLYILRDNYQGHFRSDFYGLDEPSFLSSDIDFEVPIGFQFPSAVANDLTAQFHKKEGSAQNKGSLFVQPSYFTMSNDRNNLASGGTRTSSEFKENLMSEPTDKVFCSIPTWTGQICRYIQDNTSFGDGIIFNKVSEASQPNGEDQRKIFYSYMCVAEPNKYLGMAKFHGVKALDRLSDEDLIADPTRWKNSGLWSGGDNGGLGSNIVLNTDNFNTISLGANASMPSEVRFKNSSNKDNVPANLRGKISTNEYIDVKIINAGVNNVFPTNIFYNELTIGQFMSPAIRLMETIKEGSTAPFSIDFTNQDYLDSFEFEMNVGELDDEETNPSLNDYVFLPNPYVFDLQKTVPITNPAYKQYRSYFLKPPNQGSPSVRATDTNDAGNMLLPCLSQQEKAYAIKMKSYFNPDMDYTDWVNRGGSFNGFPYNINSDPNGTADYTLINPVTNTFGDVSLSKKYNVAIIPIYKLVPAENELYGIPFVGFITNQECGNAVGQAIIPDPTIGELFAPSRSLCDGNYSKLMTTQKVVKSTAGYYPTADDYEPVPEQPNANESQFYFNWVCDYSPYLTIGASDPSITFDNTQSKFAFQGLSTSIYSGNGLFQEWNKDSASGTDATIKPNEQADSQVVTVNQRSSSFNRLYSNGTDVIHTPAREIKGIPEKVPYFYAQSGIGINSMSIFDLNDNAINCIARQQKLYQGSMLDKLGFNLEQILPFHGNSNNEFNRGYHNSHLGINQLAIDKQDNMVKPFTTNSYVNASIDIALVKSSTGANMYNLGSCLDIESNTNASSDLLLGENLPRKLDYPYLVVYSNLVDNTKYFGGQSSYDKLPAMAYVPRNYQTGDFIYSSATAWTYTADRDYVLSELIVDIRLPDGSPAPLAPNNSVIFKITRQNNILQRQQQIMQEIEQAQQPTKSNKK